MAESIPISRPKDHWTATYIGLQLAVAALCILFFLQFEPPRPPPRYALAEAEASTDGTAWHPVRLPHVPARDETGPASVLYRTTFTHSASGPDETWSVFLPRFTSGVELAVNGTVILDTRRNPAAGRVDRNVPAIAPIPQALLREGSNEITLRLFVWGPLTGYLDNLYVGPDVELRSAHDDRQFLFLTVPLLLAAWQTILGTILGLIWLNRRDEAAYGWLAAAMAAGVVQHFVPMPALPALQGLLGASASLECALVLHFAAHFTGLRIAPFGWLAFLPGLAILAAGLLGDTEALRTTYMVLGPTSIGLLTILIALVLGRAAIMGRDRSCVLLGSTLTVIVVFWAHDMLTVLNALPGERIFLGRLSYSTVLIAIGLGLTWRFVQALNAADSFAGRLVERVREAEEKLRASFAREEAQARKEALAAERTRLMRDLHDGLGGHLVSIVALAERSGGTAIGEAARAALKDLRLVIDAMEEIDGDLMLVLGSWRERIAAQLRAHGIHLTWQVLTPQGLPVFPDLRPWHVLQVMRLLDEAVTNAVKHSGATTLRIVVETVDDGTGAPGGRIVVEDDGKGFDLAAFPSASGPQAGRGLLNMTRRAELCGARLALSSGPAGTRVGLSLPAHFGASRTPDGT